MDGYKKKKLQAGRSIRAPTFRFKTLWKVYFGDSEHGSDKKWCTRREGSYLHQGYDADYAASDHRRHVLKTALGGLSIDVTALITGHAQYASYLLPSIHALLLCQVSNKLVEFLLNATQNAWLAMGDDAA